MRLLDGVVVEAETVTIFTPAASEAQVRRWLDEVRENLRGRDRVRDGSAGPEDGSFYVLQDVALFNVDDKGDRVAALRGAVRIDDDLGGAFAEALVTRKRLTAGTVTLSATSLPFAAVRDSAMPFPCDVDLVLHRRTHDSILARLDVDLRVDGLYCSTLGSGARLAVSASPPAKKRRAHTSWFFGGGEAEDDVQEEEKDDAEGDAAAASWFERARDTAGQSLLFAALADWLESPGAFKFFAERTDPESTQCQGEEAFLGALADAGLHMDADEYEALRAVAFRDADPTVEGLRRVCDRGHALWAVEMTRGEAADPEGDERRSAFFTTLVASRFARLVAKKLDPLLEGLVKDYEGGSWRFMGDDGLVLKPCVLKDDVVAALLGGETSVRNVRVGEVSIKLPPLARLLLADASVHVDVSSLAYDVVPFPVFLDEAAAAAILARAFGDDDDAESDGDPAAPSPYSFVQRLVDGVSVSLGETTIRQLNPTEAMLRERLAGIGGDGGEGDGDAASPGGRRRGSGLLESLVEPIRALFGGTRAAAPPPKAALPSRQSASRQLADVCVGGWRTIKARRVEWANRSASLRETAKATGRGTVATAKRLKLVGLSITDVSDAGAVVPFLRALDADVAVVLHRTEADARLTGVDVDVRTPPTIHLFYAALPVSLSIFLKLAVRGGDAARRHAWFDADAREAAFFASADDLFAGPFRKDPGAWANFLDALHGGADPARAARDHAPRTSERATAAHRAALDVPDLLVARCRLPPPQKKKNRPASQGGASERAARDPSPRRSQATPP